MVKNKRRPPNIIYNDVKFVLKPLRAVNFPFVHGLQCRFCSIDFHREKTGQKHKPTIYVPSWNTPFRYKNIEVHVSEEHHFQRAEYRALGTNDERS